MSFNLTVTVSIYAQHPLTQEIEKLNAKAAKLDCQPISLTFSSPYSRIITATADQAVTEDVIDATLVGSPPKLNGWRFIGRIERAAGADENLIHTVPGERAPEEYRKVPYWRCQHCNIDLKTRKNTWVVQHDDGTYKQVGSTCLADFTGRFNPERLVKWWMLSIKGIESFIESLEQERVRRLAAGTFFEEGGRSAMEMLKTTLALVKRDGGYEYPNDYKIGTPGKAWIYLYGATTSRRDYSLEELDIEAPDILQRAADIKAWVEEHVADSDYFRNLSVMFKATWLEPRKVRFVASAVYSYMKAKCLHAWQHFKNEHVGKVGDKLKLELKVTTRYVLDGQYGTTQLLLLQDAEGRIFKWNKTSNGDVLVGESLKLAGTVKKHEVYNAKNQTVLTYCKVIA